jgi:predicted DNA-binding transcriptional regulator AlpA
MLSKIAVATDAARPDGLLIDIKGVATMLGRSPRSIYRDDSAGRMPRSIKLGGSKKWCAAEILAWVDAGCPDRRKWEVSRKPSGLTKTG